MATATVLAASVLERVSDEVAALAERMQDSLVLVQTPGGGAGSGIVWRADGLVLTNHHVVPQERAEVVLRSGHRLPAMVVDRAPRRDLAALQVQAGGLTAAAIGDATRLRVGELLVALGNPLGLRGAVTVGVVSGVGRRFGPQGTRGQEVIQADIALAPGNSGGPLLNAYGQVVGINAMVMAPGMALAVPSHVAQAFVAGEGSGAMLGVTVQEVALPPALRGQIRKERALLLLNVATGGPADRAGLLPGDLLLALNGRPLDEVADLLDRMEAQRPGVALPVEVLRGGRSRSITVTPVQA